MGKKQIIKMIIDELKKTSDTEFLLTVYMFIKKVNGKGDN